MNLLISLPIDESHLWKRRCEQALLLLLELVLVDVLQVLLHLLLVHERRGSDQVGHLDVVVRIAL